jgi:hypothetical protein
MVRFWVKRKSENVILLKTGSPVGPDGDRRGTAEMSGLVEKQVLVRFAVL